MRLSPLCRSIVVLLVAGGTIAIAQPPASISYDAVTDRGPRPKPALIKLGAAGFSFNDPVFGTRIWRVTDGQTRTDKTNRSFRTPSSSHQNAWSADASRFYVVSTDGTVIPFSLDPATGVSSRLDPLKFYIEPQFSYVNASVIYGSVSGGNLHTIDQYDFSTGAYTQLLNLESVVGGLSGTFIGGVASSAGPTERILAFFGGSAQDKHHYVIVFDRATPANRKLLDTSSPALNFSLHHATIDRSGRYVMLYPASPDLAAPRNAAQVYVWDTLLNVTTPLPIGPARSGGHDAFGFGMAVNKDCCTSTSYDAAQWQIRALSAPLTTRDILQQIVTPKEVQLSDHPTWNNARADMAVPFITATYRYGIDTVEWRPWDDEVLAVPTDGGQDVWRFAQHRSTVANDNDPTQEYFWYEPRPNVSSDGRWVLFTSNWQKTLGTDPAGEAGGMSRQDIFLLRLPILNDTLPAPPLPPLSITTTAVTDATRNTLYAFTLLSTHPAASWRVSKGRLPEGLTLDPSGVIYGTPTVAGGIFFQATVSDRTGSVSEIFLLMVHP